MRDSGIFGRLANGRSPDWAWMDRFDAPNYDGNDPLAVYLTRWRVVQTPWFGIYVHRYTSPDPRPTLHTHPWGFLSIVLRGGYVERRWSPDGSAMHPEEHHTVRRFNRVHLRDAHAIRRLLRNPTWTLLLVGRRKMTWGYWERKQTMEGWTQWVFTPFDEHAHNQEFKNALGRRKAAMHG